VIKTQTKGEIKMSEEQKQEQKTSQPLPPNLPVASRIMLFSNGNIHTFNKKGEHIPFLEGNLFEKVLIQMKKDKVLDDNTVIEHINLMANPKVAQSLAEVAQSLAEAVHKHGAIKEQPTETKQ